MPAVLSSRKLQIQNNLQISQNRLYIDMEQRVFGGESTVFDRSGKVQGELQTEIVEAQPVLSLSSFCV